MNETKPFTDPSSDLPERDRLRTSICYNRKTVGFLAKIHCRKSTEQTTTNILLEKLKAALERSGLTEYDPDAYERFVLDCIILGKSEHANANKPRRTRSTASVPPTRSEPTVAGEATERNDG